MFDSDEETFMTAAGPDIIDLDDEKDSAEYVDFMQSQAIDLSDLNHDHDRDDLFVRSDEELSDLDCFTSIDRLMARGGDDRRRAEFILRQFKKSTVPAAPVVVLNTAKRKPAAGRSLGVRRR